MVGQEHRADDHGVDALGEQLGDEDEVALRLAHLLALVADHARVHVGLRERTVEPCRTVRGPHLVVGEDEVAAPALDVDGQSGLLLGDDRALDVPAGSARSEAAPVPGRFAVTRGPPQQRVERVLLARGLRISAAFGRQPQHRRLVVVADAAEGRLDRGGDPVVDVAGLERVRRSGLDERRDRLGDLRDRFDDADIVLRRDDAQRLHVVAEELDLGVGEFAPVDAGGFRAFEEGVVDVSGVLDVDDVESGVAPHPTEQIEGDVGGRMPEVGRIVGGDPADVEGRRPVLAGELPRTARPRVEDRGQDAGGGQRGQFGSGPRLHADQPNREAGIRAFPRSGATG
ncbi:Uncharacterised protein [Mycobacteroides abscessus subsp. abscessus]|nr:Uncharacterised protein [Mycobacteroides abscessus subsp. abscessus]